MEFERNRNRPVVVLIEDNLTQLALYAMTLEDEFDVLKAARGEQGYALTSVHQPAAVVVDVVLPDMDGLTLCERLRANPRTASIPVVVLTGDDDAFARAQGMRVQLHAVLAKPCAADRLLSVLRSAVAGSRT